jgi:hypothetical protein
MSEFTQHFYYYFLKETGSDYTSYFKTFGEVTVLNVFFQHVSFINGRDNPGCVSQFDTDNTYSGYYVL